MKNASVFARCLQCANVLTQINPRTIFLPAYCKDGTETFTASNLPTGVTGVNSTTGVVSGKPSSNGAPDSTVVTTSKCGIINVDVKWKPCLIFSTIAPTASGFTAPAPFIQISIDGGAFFFPTLSTNYYALVSLQIKAAASFATNNGFFSQAFTITSAYSDTTVIGATSSTHLQFLISGQPQPQAEFAFGLSGDVLNPYSPVVGISDTSYNNGINGLSDLTIPINTATSCAIASHTGNSGSVNLTATANFFIKQQ